MHGHCFESRSYWRSSSIMFLSVAAIFLVMTVSSASSPGQRQTWHLRKKRVLLNDFKGKEDGEMKTTTAFPSPCGDNFHCGTLCVHKENVCDSEIDCTLAEDEQNCPKNCSGANQFKCRDGQCTPVGRVCDEFEDCWDRSDEMNCHAFPCNASTHWQCLASGACLDSEFRCDGYQDCNDGSDERDCSYK